MIQQSHSWACIWWRYTQPLWNNAICSNMDGPGDYHTKWSKSNKEIPYDITYAAAAAAKLLQSCPTLYDPIDGSPPGSPIPGIVQARVLMWVAISFSNARKWKVKVKSLSRVQLLATPWTAAHQVPLSMGFSRQEYWSGVPLPSLHNTSTECFFLKHRFTSSMYYICLC